MNEDLDSYQKYMEVTFSVTTMKMRMCLLKSYLKYCSKKKINHREATKDDVCNFLKSCNCINNTRSSYRDYIQSFYTFLRITPNPACSIEIMRSAVPIKPVKSIEKIIQQIDTVFYRSLRNGLIIELMYSSGLRCGEVCRLNTSDIDINEKTVYVKGKGDSNRYVPLSSTFLNRVKEYDRFTSGARGPLFISIFKKRMQPASISKIIKMKTGIPAHQYRRAGATHMLQAGCDIRFIQEYLGHKLLATTQRYTHIDKSDLRRIINTHHPRNKI